MKNTLIIAQLQMNYIAAQLEKDNQEDQRCPLCWKPNTCGCNYTVLEDSFINLNEPVHV